MTNKQRVEDWEMILVGSEMRNGSEMMPSIRFAETPARPSRGELSG